MSEEKLTLKKYLIKHRITQADFCRKFNINKSQLSRYLAGDVGFGKAVINRILEATGDEMNYDTLYYPTDIPKIFKKRLKRLEY